MSIIFSDAIDPSLNEVIFYLIGKGHDFTYFSNQSTVPIEKIEINQCKWVYSFEGIDLSKSKFLIWRKGILNIGDVVNFDVITKEAISFLKSQFVTNNIFGNVCNEEYSKLEVLKIAIRFGFLVPPTYLFFDFKGLSNFISNNNVKSFITKPVQDSLSSNEKDYQYTKRFVVSDLKEVNFPFLLQDEVKKEFEVRSFVFNNKIFSMAIFSSKSHIDHRKDDDGLKIRMISFDLPEYLKQKLFSMLNYLEVNTASFDFIYSKGNFYFLEMNMSGQFGYLSQRTNAYVEKKNS